MQPDSDSVSVNGQPANPSQITKILAYLALCSIGLIAVIPFLQPFHDAPITNFYSEWLAFGLGLVASVPLLSSIFWKNPTVPTISVYLLAAIGIIAIQILAVERVYLSQALLPALYLAWIILLVIVTGWLRTQFGLERVILILAWFLLAGGVLHALFSITQHLDTQAWLSPWIVPKQDNTVIGNVAQRNHLATHVMLSGLALCYLVAKRRLLTWVGVVFLAILVIALALTGSRSVLLYVPGVLLLSIYAYRKTNNHVHLRMMFASGVLLILFLLTQYILPLVNEMLRTFLPEPVFHPDYSDLETAIGRSGMEGIKDRLIEWHKAWLMFLEAPLFGIGISQYGWHSFVLHGYMDFTTPRLTIFHHTHNIFMQILAESGFIGFSLLMLMLATWLKQFYKNWLTPEGWLIAAVLLVLFIHSNLEYPLWYSYFLGIAGVFFALGDSRVRTISFSPSLGQVGTALSLLLAFVIFAATYNGYRKLVNVNALVRASSPEQAANTLQKIAMNPLLVPWAEAAMATHGRPDKDKIDRQLALTTRVMRHDPNPVKTYRQIAYLTLAGSKDEALTLLRRVAVAYTPLFPEYVCGLKTIQGAEMYSLIREGELLVGKDLECATLKRKLPPLITLHKNR